MSAHTPRSFEVPAALVAAGFGPVVDLDVLDREVEFPGEFGEWAEKVLVRENTKTLDDVCGDMRLLPRGVLASVQLDDGSLLISGLVDSDGRVWDHKSNAWRPPEDEIDIVDGSVILEDDEVAFVARALREGADEVWFRPYIPKAFVSAVVAAPETPAAEPVTTQEVPAGSAIIAVVDPIDEDAVLEMLAVTPGPKVLRRHDGQWFEDPEWIPVLKSVKPPKIVKLTEAQIASVTTQIDRSTDESEWEPFEADSREQYQIFTASAGRSPYVQQLQRETDEAALFALVAVAGRKLTPKDAIATERLKRYWTVGKGAAKIRWGTPGSWRRCYRHLVKYVGPKIAPGYCTNLSQRLGGHGIATHVGTKAKRRLTSSAEPYISGDAWDIAGHKIIIDPEGIGEMWYSHPDGSIGDPTCLGSAENTVWVRDPSTNDETWRTCPEHGFSCEDGAYTATCQHGDCGWTNYYLGYGSHPLEVDGEIPEAVTAANPTGINGYDKGMTFEESTKGVERDYFGRFAPESGSSRSKRRSERAKRRKSSMARRKKAREEKESKKTDTTAKKAEAERKRAENTAQREDLARISLEIAQLRSEGKDLEAAELRVRYAEKAVEYADTPTQKLNAQAALVNAKDALREKKYAIARKRKRDAEAEAERLRRERERASREESRTRQAQENLETSLGI